MKVSVLGSGSFGNAIYVEHDGSAILIDAGFSTAEMDRRLVWIGVVGHSHIKALFLTHATHTDHVAHAAKISGKWHIPVYGLDNWKDALLKIPGMTVGAFAVPHDDVGACGYVVTTEDERSLGLVMDAGCVTDEMAVHLRGCEVLILGCDYDKQLLADNPHYAPELKKRIQSPTGHLSNQQVAAWLRDGWDGKSHTIVLAHLSKNNNTPERALKAAAEALAERFGMERVPGGLTILVSTQDAPTELVTV